VTETAAAPRNRADRGALRGGQTPEGSVTRLVSRTLETSPFPILLVSLVGIVLLTVFGPSIVVGDTWLTLMAGREVVDHGLPRTEEITVLGQGATWTDQQWLAQLAFYAAHELAGMRAVVVLDVALVAAALGLVAAAARTSGASSRSTFVVGLLAVLAGPWGWTIRAQSTALPLYAALLWLLVDAARSGPRRRTLLALPLLGVWANLHGSVVLGAGLTVLLGITVLVRQRRFEPIPLALVVLAPLMVFASPYGTDLVAYYDLMLVDAPFAEILSEWQWSRPDGTTALFWLLALLGLALLAVRRCRQRQTLFELVVLAVTFAGAVQAVRGVIWFALAAAAILPVALDGFLTRADVQAPKVNRTISLAALAGLALALVITLVRPASFFVSEWPEERLAAVRTATRDPSVKLLATDGTADWLLWRIPDLRGRIAYDVRFELYDQRTLDAIVAYGNRKDAEWRALADGYSVVIVDEREHLEAHRAEQGARVVFRDDEIAIITRGQ
jgi:MYXO-CTERM domain-containing protein